MNYGFNDFSFADMTPYPNFGFNSNDNYNYNGSNMNMNFNATNMNTSSNNMMNNNNMNNFNTNNNLANPSEGYMRGNLFNNLYNQYKNYRPATLTPSNEMEEALLNLNELSFASHELRLYLDIYPNDSEMIELFNRYQGMANQALMEYENRFGPITWSALSNTNEFGWQSTPWPWEMEVM